MSLYGRACIIALFCLPALSGCNSGTIVNNGPQAATPIRMSMDPRSDDQMVALLPASSLQQTQFPKPYMANMMRNCINISVTLKTLYAKAGKADEYCSCFNAAMVSRFTLSEYMTASSSRWDYHTVADLAKKRDEIQAQCTQTTLK